MSTNGDTPRVSRERVEAAARFYGTRGLAILWTPTNEGEAAKAATGGWKHAAVPQPDGDGAWLNAAGIFSHKIKKCNVGVALAKSNVIGIDCDGPEGVAEFQKLNPPPTLTAESSPGKRHYFFRAPKDADMFKVEFSGGTVITSKDGYLITAPSLHPLGHEYRFLPEEGGNEIVEMPDALYWSIRGEVRKATEEVEQILRDDTGAKVPEGARHRTMLSLAGALRRRGVPLESALRTVEEFNVARCEPPRSGEHVRSLVRDVYRRYYQAEPDYEFDFNEDELPPIPNRVPGLSEIELAAWFVEMHPDEFKNTNDTMRQWFANEKSNGLWAEDNAAKVLERMIERELQRVPMIADGLPQDYPGRKGYVSKAHGMQTAAKRNAIISVIRNNPVYGIERTDLDAHPLLLAARNGVIDLRTGILHPHDSGLLLTRGSPLDYDPAATAPRWEQFLKEIFLDDANLIEYVQRVCGYCLTGDISLEMLWILYGDGGNGKSKFFATMRFILGRALYRTARFETFTASKWDNIPTDIARLDRARLVVASEKKKQRVLDEGVINSLTGGDPITARFMRENEFEFMPQFKVWLVANIPPSIDSSDGGIRRRVRMIPFNAKFEPGDPSTDTALLRKLHAEAPGILAWAVRGAVAWEQDGLGIAARVETATMEYMEQMNPLQNFIEDECEVGEEFEVTFEEIRDAVDDWRRLRGDERMRDNTIAAALAAVPGVQKIRRSTSTTEGRVQTMVWKGIRLKASTL